MAAGWFTRGAAATKICIFPHPSRRYLALFDPAADSRGPWAL